MITMQSNLTSLGFKCYPLFNRRLWKSQSSELDFSVSQYQHYDTATLTQHYNTHQNKINILKIINCESEFRFFSAKYAKK